MKVTFFATQLDFRAWLEKNANTEKELIVGYYKVSSNKPSMTWSQSVDQALCFGWIDGIRKSIDDESYCIRFTPRRITSIWSNINIKKVDELTKLGLMKPEGLRAFELRKEHKSRIYNYEKETITLDLNYENLFKKEKKAWLFFHNHSPSYKKQMIHWIMTAKQEKTQLSRLAKLITLSQDQKKAI
jgi:uncharacterized protein YdeI (YjbR/CyaY-like superfamily)